MLSRNFGEEEEDDDDEWKRRRNEEGREDRAKLTMVARRGGARHCGGAPSTTANVCSGHGPRNDGAARSWSSGAGLEVGDSRRRSSVMLIEVKALGWEAPAKIKTATIDYGDGGGELSSGGGGRT